MEALTVDLAYRTELKPYVWRFGYCRIVLVFHLNNKIICAFSIVISSYEICLVSLDMQNLFL